MGKYDSDGDEILDAHTQERKSRQAANPLVAKVQKVLDDWYSGNLKPDVLEDALKRAVNGVPSVTRMTPEEIQVSRMTAKGIDVPAIASRLDISVEQANALIESAGAKYDPAAALTDREVQVMEMLACGKTNREIAKACDISVKTVDTHRGHVMKKLDLRNNSELTSFAVKHGYITL
jgi:DNA-binding NarL/FixJ family response regulator